MLQVFVAIIRGSFGRVDVTVATHLAIAVLVVAIVCDRKLKAWIPPSGVWGPLL